MFSEPASSCSLSAPSITSGTDKLARILFAARPQRILATGEFVVDDRSQRRALHRGLQARPPARGVLLVIEFQRLLIGARRGAGIWPRQHSDADDVRVRDRGECGVGDPPAISSSGSSAANTSRRSSIACAVLGAWPEGREAPLIGARSRGVWWGMKHRLPGRQLHTRMDDCWCNQRSGGNFSRLASPADAELHAKAKSRWPRQALWCQRRGPRPWSSSDGNRQRNPARPVAVTTCSRFGGT